MQKTYINERCLEIIQIILQNNTYLSVKNIAELMQVSKRTVYYDLCQINDWLEENKIPKIQVVRGKGIFVEKKTKSMIEKCIEKNNTQKAYILSPIERVHIIICMIISAEKKIYIEQLMEQCLVSRNTIFHDLRGVIQELEEYDLKLEYEPKNGYTITGDIIRIRAIFLSSVYSLKLVFEINKIHFIDEEKISKYLKKLKLVEQELGTSYVDGTLWSLAVLLPIIEKSNSNLVFENLRRIELENTKEYHMIEKQFPEFQKEEQIYLCLHLLGARVNVVSNDIFENDSNQMIYEMTKILVAEFEKIACVIFKKRDELEHSLFIHISASMYRYQFGIIMADDMSEDIIREYPDLFEITKIVSSSIKKQVGLPISDREIAYLALHFGSHLSVINKEEKQLRILIICANGISTGNMIKRELRKMLPTIHIVGVFSSFSIQNIQEICDLVISTVKVNSIIPVIYVNPILSKMDRKMILNHPKVQEKYRAYSVEKIFSIVQPYIDEKDYDALKKDLLIHLKNPIQIESENTYIQKGLIDVLTVDSIGIHDTEYTWMRAIQETGKKMKEKGSIENSYLERIISQIRYYGPYMFIAPRVVLAHAKPEDGANSLDVSMHIFRKSIVFSDFHKANIIFVLSTKDQESHLKILKDIVTICSIQVQIDTLLTTKTPEEILKYLYNPELFTLT